MLRRLYMRPFVILPLRALAAGAFLTLAACGGAEPEPVEEAEPTAVATGGTEVYTVRAEVVELPDPNDPTTGFYLHHEPIHEFRNMDGEVDGMDSMTMPFAVGDEVSLDGISEGDKVEFDLAVDWEGDPMMEIVRVEVIPTDTQLAFGKAEPPD